MNLQASRPVPARLSRPAAGVALFAVAGLGIATYLTWTKLTGGVPVCGPSGGCETVDASAYSVVAGVPVALFGILHSATVLGLALWWGRTRDRRAAYALYAIGLAGVLVEAYLVYLELFVIHAICAWCVAYGTTVIAEFVLAAAIVRRPA